MESRYAYQAFEFEPLSHTHGDTRGLCAVSGQRILLYIPGLFRRRESEVGYSAGRRVELRERRLTPTLSLVSARARARAESHYPSVRDALARQNCTRIVHQTVPHHASPDDNPFSPTLPNASISSYEINQALSEVRRPGRIAL